MQRERTVIAAGLRATAFTLALTTVAGAADVSRRLDDYVLFATDGLRTRGLHVVAGDVGVDAGVLDTRAAVAAPASTIGADVVRLAGTSTCQALFATGIDRTMPGCPLLGVFPGPVIGDLRSACGLPRGLPACAVGGGVAVGAGESRVLPPGTYGALDVRSGGHVVLAAGRYVFCGARVGRRARIDADDASEILVAGDVAIGPGATLATTTSAPAFGPALIVDGDRVNLSRGVTAMARLCAPHARLVAGDETSLVGRFAARSIRTGRTTATGLARGSVTTTSSTSPVPTTTSTSSTSIPIPTTSSTSSTTSSSSSFPPTTSTSSTSTSAPPTSTAPTTSSTVGTVPPTSTSTTSTTAPPTTSTTATTTTSTSTTRPAAVCGNGAVEPGETCDDGNTLDGDSCPSNCRIELCTAVPSTARAFTVNFTHPAGVDVAGITVLVDYPEGRVSIPGSGADNSVKTSITNLPTGALGTPNDLDYAVREVVASFSPIPAGRLFTLTLQDCQGATPPAASEFGCRVEDAADQFGLSVDGVTCTVQ